jgi:uncharacterized protein
MEESGMSSPLLGTSDFDLDELDAFLMSDRAPEDSMQLSDLDGFLAGIAVGPELIMPSEWVPVIWGGGEPEFESMEEAQRILNAIMGRYNEILHLLQHAPEEFEPIFWTTKDGEAVAADWAEGFMEAVELRPGAWETLLASEEDRQLLMPIVAHLHDEDGDPIIRGDVDDIGQLRRESTELIAPCVVLIDRFWKARRQAPGRTPKPGRNDPCPCGSGRKYKRCCGAN